jgi:heptosyltransferase-2/heptosyltransferase-3
MRPDHLGDVLFTGPALRQLAGAGLEVTLLVGPWSAEVARMLPGPTRVETLAFPWFDRRPKAPVWSPYLQLFAAARRIRRGAFDAAIVFRDDDWWSALAARLAGVPVRAGHLHPGAPGSLTHALRHAPEHSAAAALALAAAFIGRGNEPPDPTRHPLRVRLTQAHRAAARQLLDRGDAWSGDLVIVHPGSGSVLKRWEPERWGELLASRNPDTKVAVTGGPAEVELAERTARAIGNPVVSLAGQTDLETLAALLEIGRVVLGPDSGPLHLAVAVGTPTVHLFGPASRRKFGPWGPADRHKTVALALPCAPCGRLDWPDPSSHPCVTALPVAAAAFALRTLCDGLEPSPIIP